MKYLHQFFLALVWRRMTTLLSIVLVSVAIGLFARVSYQQFLYLQGQNIDRLSVFNEFILPLSGLVLFLQIFMIITTQVQILPQLASRNLTPLISHSSLSAYQLFKGVLFPSLIISLWPWVIFVAIVTMLSTVSELDLARILTIFAGLLVIHIVVSFIVIALCWRSKNQLLSITLSITLVFGLLIVEMSIGYWWSEYSGPRLFSSIIELREGYLSQSVIVSFIGWLLFSFCLANRRILLSTHGSSLKLNAGLVLGALLVFVAGIVNDGWDLTRDAKNTLSQQVANVLASQTDPLRIVAVIDDETARDEILVGFNMIQRHLGSVSIEFKSRQSLPPNQQVSGEYVQFQLGELHQTIPFPFNQEVKFAYEKAVLKLTQRKQEWIVFIEGHGEAGLFSNKPTDMSLAFQMLRDAGWPVATQNLFVQPTISDNTRLLVIAGGDQSWLQAEERRLQGFLERGGSLLVLTDPSSKTPKIVESYSGISRHPGTLVDWSGYQKGTPHPAVLIIDKLNSHPVVNRLDQLLAFPWASGLIVEKNSVTNGGKISSVLSTHTGVWNEFDISEEKLAHDAESGELKQAFEVAVAYENSKLEQRIMVIGDSHFASDSAINNYGNKQFLLNTVSWLTASDAQNVANGKALDQYIAPSAPAHIFFLWVNPFVIPMLLIGAWFYQWRLRSQGSG